MLKNSLCEPSRTQPRVKAPPLHHRRSLAGLFLVFHGLEPWQFASVFPVFLLMSLISSPGLTDGSASEGRG